MYNRSGGDRKKKNQKQMSKNSWGEDVEFKFFIVVKKGKLIVKLLMNQSGMISVNREIVKWEAHEARYLDL